MQAFRDPLRFARATLLAWSAYIAVATPLPAQPASADHPKLLVVSVDGLDWRYLRDRDQQGERIPNLRQMLQEGEVADGVTGVWPTITWPSHTSLITGVPPDVHGVLGNRRPRAEGGDYYWSAGLVRVPTLLSCAADNHLTSAAVTWPVTVDGPITWNLPEFFQHRDGGSMDMASVGSKAVPDTLVAEISKDEPSFPQQWMDDRTRTLATIWLLRHHAPDLLLVHLVDLDSAQHEMGPFNVPSRATLERTDTLLGQMRSALPAGYSMVVTSDHGFERVDQAVNLDLLLQQHGIRGKVRSLGGLAVTSDPEVAAFLQEESAAGKDGIGRVVSPRELNRYAPSLSGALIAVVPREHSLFGSAGGSDAPNAATHDRPSAAGEAVSSKPSYLTSASEKGNHGFWPVRGDYASVYLLVGAGVRPTHLGRIEMTDIQGRLAARLGITCSTAPGAKSGQAGRR